MTTEKILNTRIINKHADLLGEKGWENSTLQLKEGEIALAKVTLTEQHAGGQISEVPAYLVKIGVEGKTFNESAWAYAKAADVHAWAKQTSLPVECGDDTTVEGYVSGNVISSVYFENGKIKYTTATVATSEGFEALTKRITAIEGYLELSQDEDGNPIVGLVDRVSALETLVGNISVNEQINSAIETLIGDDSTFTDIYTLKSDLKIAIQGDTDTTVYEVEEELKELIGETIPQLHRELQGSTSSTISDVEDQVSDLAGEDRTTETVKGNADAIAALDLQINGKPAQGEEAAVLGLKDTKADKSYVDETFTTPSDVTTIVDNAIAAVSNTDTIEGITNLVTYVNEHGADLTAIVKEVYGDSVTDIPADGISRIDTAVSDASEAKRIAEAASQKVDEDTASAQSYAQAAAGSAASAQANAATATQKAADAAGSATEAVSSATNAASAQAAAESAKGAAESAQQAAEAAQESATQAKFAAEEAKSAAETAQGKAEDAQYAAETAQGKAEEAERNATEQAQYASQYAAEASQYKFDAESAKGLAETAQGYAEDAQEAAEFARDEAVAAKEAALASNTSATAIANEAKSTADAAKALADSAVKNIIVDTHYADNNDDPTAGPQQYITVNAEGVADEETYVVRLTEAAGTALYLGGKAIVGIEADSDSADYITISGRQALGGSTLAEDPGHTVGLTESARNAIESAKTAVQEITSNCTADQATSGLKVTRSENSVNVEIDDAVTFIFDCGGAE